MAERRMSKDIQQLVNYAKAMAANQSIGYGTTGKDMVCNEFVSAVTLGWSLGCCTLVPAAANSMIGRTVNGWRYYKYTGPGDIWPGDILLRDTHGGKFGHVAISVGWGGPVAEAAGAGPLPDSQHYYNEADKSPFYQSNYNPKKVGGGYWERKDGKGTTTNETVVHGWIRRNIPYQWVEEIYEDRWTYIPNTITTYLAENGDQANEVHSDGGFINYDCYARCMKAWDGIDHFEIPTGSGTRYYNFIALN